MSQAHKRLHTLLTDRAIAGLDAREREEFDHLRAGAVDPSYELASAAIELALLPHVTPMPASVEAAIGEQAARYFGFLQVRPNESTAGARGPTAGARGRAPTREATPEPDILLGEDGLLPGDGDPVPRARLWELSPRVSDESLESGVLESSLADGRIERGLAPGESGRGEIPRERSRRRSERTTAAPPAEAVPEAAPRARSEPRPKARPKSKPEPAARRDDDVEHVERERDTTDASLSLSDALETSKVVPMPVSESKLARVATYVSAGAAVLMLALAFWLYQQRGETPDPETLEQQVEAADDKLEWSFVKLADPAVGEATQGTVLWSSELQSGVLILDGLPVNDPSESQYQLWIDDAQREGPPVDGGVFDITSEGQTRVAIDAKLVIGQPTAFKLTVERPGGVVVSSQDRLLMVAAGSGGA